MPGLRVVEPTAYFVRVPAETDMTNIILNFPRTAAARPAFTNSAVALKLLTRSRGVTILQLATATGWQPHSVRAHLSGLRKKGVMLLREISRTDEGIYRVSNVGVADHASQARAMPSPAYTAKAADIPDVAIATTSAIAVA